MSYIEIRTIAVWSISSIFIGITYFYFFEIRNSEQHRVIVGYIPTPGQKISTTYFNYYYYGWIYITNFSCYLLLGFHALIFYSTKIRNNIVDSLSCMLVESAEPQENSRVKMIVVNKIGLLLEFNQYSCD